LKYAVINRDKIKGVIWRHYILREWREQREIFFFDGSQVELALPF
jgi:hypothetical protein